MADIEDDVKITCKQCGQKFKVANAKEIVCEEPDCNVKYNMTGYAVTFREFKLPGKEPEYISSFTTPEPKKPTTVEFTEAEWYAICQRGEYSEHQLF